MHPTPSSQCRPPAGNRKTERRLMTGLVIAATAAVAIAGCGKEGPAGSGGLTPISVGYIASTAGFAPELMIQNDPSMCAPYGIEPQMRMVSPQTSGPALAAGQIQVMRHSSGALLTSAFQNPSAVKIVASVSSPPYVVWGTKDIKSIADLRGKTVGVTAAGSTGDLAMRQLLAASGMEAGKDVSVTFGGDATAVLGLAASGAIQGFLFPPPLPDVAAKAGVHQVADLAAFPTVQPTLATVIAVSEPFASQNRAAVKGYLQCAAAAMKATLAKDPKAAEALAKAGGKALPKAQKEIEALAVPGAFALKPFTVDAARDVIHALEMAKVQQFGNFDPAVTIDPALLPAE